MSLKGKEQGAPTSYFMQVFLVPLNIRKQARGMQTEPLMDRLLSNVSPPEDVKCRERGKCTCVGGRGWVVSFQEQLKKKKKKRLFVPGYLSDLGKQEKRLKGKLNSQPQTRPVQGNFPNVGGSLQGQLIKESNQDSQLLFHLHSILLCVCVCVFFLS